MREDHAKAIGGIVRELAGRNKWPGGDIERAEELAKLLRRAGFWILPKARP